MTPQAIPQSPPSPADPDALVSVRAAEIADDPDLRDLATLFVRALPDRAAALERAVAAGELTVIRREANRLTGTARTFGFPTLAAVAADVEAEVRATPPGAALRPAVARLADLCRRIRIAPAG